MKLVRNGGLARRRRLRKQPAIRRMQTAPAMTMPRMRVPKTAQQRRRRNRKRFHFPAAALKRILLSPRWISLFLLAITIAALVLAGMYEDYYVTFIPVEGVASIPPEQVVESSNLAGAHVFAVDPEEAAGRIAALPGVISATVTLSWPNQVAISIREEAPVAIWIEDGEQYWVSESGKLLPARMELKGLMTIERLKAEQVAADLLQGARVVRQEAGVSGQHPPFLPLEVLEAALELRELWPGQETFQYESATGLSFADSRGWRAYFGAGAGMERKMVVYQAIVSDLLARGLRPLYVSVANDEKPYYRVQEREVGTDS